MSNLYYKLLSKPSLGKISEDQKVFYDIGEGQLFVTPKEDYYLLNFWIKGEYDVEVDGKMQLLSYLGFEVLTKIYEPLNSSYQEIIVPNRELVNDGWEKNYFTHFYNGIHQSVNDVKLIIEKVNKELFEIKFIGRLSEDNYIVDGSCQLEIENELKGYWI